jgi:hypothetical protein
MVLFCYQNIYQSPFQILIQFKSSFFDKEQKHVEFKLNSVLNPFFKNEDIITQNELQAKDQYWTLQGGLDMISDMWNIKPGKICISSLIEDVLIVPDANERCDEIRKYVCANYPLEPCVRQVADFSKAPTLELKFFGNSAKLSPEMYLYFQDDNLECRFEEFSHIKSNECDPDSSFGVGKFFMQYYVMILEYGQNNNKVILLNHFERETDEPKWWALIFLFSIFALAIITFYFMVVFEEVKRRRTDSDLSQVLVA